MSRRNVLVRVSVFVLAMVLVAAGLVVVFGQFRFASSSTYHANFANASLLKNGSKVRIAGVDVGSVRTVKLNPDNTVDIAFEVDKSYQLYSSTRASIRYENLVGDRFLEITAGPGDLQQLPPGGTIDLQHTDPALDLDALLGGLRPVLKGLEGEKINEITSSIVQLLQGQGGALSDVLSNTGAFTQNVANRHQLISDVIQNLSAVLATADDKRTQFDTSVDQLQQVIASLEQGRDPIAGAISPLAAAEKDLTDMLVQSRRPLQGVIENVRPFATELDDRKAEINGILEPLAENWLRLNALGAYGAFFNIFFCSVSIKFSGPAGSDVVVPVLFPPDPTRGRCSENG